MFIRRLTYKTLKYVSKSRHLRVIAWALLISAMLFLVGSFGVNSPTKTPTVSARADLLTAFPIKSAGCDKTSPVEPGATINQTIVSGGITRSYLLHIPTGYHNSAGQPLILNFHGHGGTARQQEYYSGFSTLANIYDVVVAYPQGAIGPDNHTGWDTGPRQNPNTNDVLFVSDLLNHLQATLCINPHRIYASGFSNGGGMTNVLACKLAGRIAAFASVSGAYPTVPGGCSPARPVPFIELHGTNDRIVPYNGALYKGYPPVALWLRQWAQRDGCASNPVIFFDQTNVIGEKWTGCRDNVTIEHYVIGGMGHYWPRHIVIRTQGKSTTSLNATTMIWSFFENYSLPTSSYIASGTTTRTTRIPTAETDPTQ